MWLPCCCCRCCCCCCGERLNYVCLCFAVDEWEGWFVRVCVCPFLWFCRSLLLWSLLFVMLCVCYSSSGWICESYLWWSLLFVVLVESFLSFFDNNSVLIWFCFVCGNHNSISVKTLLLAACFSINSLLALL